MPRPSNYNEIPLPSNPTNALIQAFPSGTQNLQRLARLWRPDGVNLEQLIATMSRVSNRVIDRETGIPYSADELSAKIIAEISTGTPLVLDSPPISQGLLVSGVLTFNGAPLTIPFLQPTDSSTQWTSTGEAYADLVNGWALILTGGLWQIHKKESSSVVAIWNGGAAASPVLVEVYTPVGGGPYAITGNATVGYSGTDADYLLQFAIVNGGEQLYICVNLDPVLWFDLGGSGGGAWGDITGTLADQTDLSAALTAKADAAATATALALKANLAGGNSLTGQQTITLPGTTGVGFKVVATSDSFEDSAFLFTKSVAGVPTVFFNADFAGVYTAGTLVADGDLTAANFTGTHSGSSSGTNTGDLTGVVITKPDGSRTSYPLSANTDAGRGLALQSAMAAAVAGDTIDLSPGNYDVAKATSTVIAVATHYSILAGMTIRLNGARLYHQAAFNGAVFFGADAVDGWSILGPGTIEGTVSTPTGSPSGEIGINTRTSRRWKLDKLTIRYMKNTGFQANSSSYVGGKVGTGMITNCNFDYNNINYACYAGSEYITATACTFNYGLTAIDDYAGNTRFVNCEATYNTNDALIIRNGGNDGHGCWIGGMMNHNLGFCVRSEASMDLGYTFAGSHFFADSATTNKIQSLGGGLSFNGCIIDSPFYASATPTGKNSVSNCFISGTFTNITDLSVAERAQWIFANNFTLTGAWVENDYSIAVGSVISGTNLGDQTTINGITGTMSQFDTAVTDGNFVYQGQALGTPLSGNLANCTAFPTANLSGLGTGVVTALGLAPPAAGAFVVNGGALGTPASGVVTNLTGTGGFNTTGSAASLTTTRTIGGSNFNGTANVTSFPSPGAIGGTTPSTVASTAITSPTLTGTTTLTLSSGASSNIILTPGATSGMVAVGAATAALMTATSTGGLMVSSTNTAILLSVENQTASASGAGSLLALYSNDGAAMASGDRLGGVLFGGSSSTVALRGSALISAFASQLWVDATAQGTELRFETTPNGSTTRAVRLTLQNDGVGAFAVGVSTPNIIDPNKVITPAGTTGARTINAMSGTVNAAAAATSIVVTNSLITVDSLADVFLRTNDTTAVLKNWTCAAGSLTIRFSAAPTAETSVGFKIQN